MYLSKIVVLLFVLSTRSCCAKITAKTPELDDSGLVEATVEILKSCYGNRVTPVGLAGNSTGIISETLWYRMNSPVTLINTATKDTDNGPVLPQLRYKLQVFVVTASSSTTLAGTLKGIKASIWWNHMAEFLILDWSPSSRDCSNAFEILWAAWEMNALNAKFVCNHRTRGRLIYTYNPYTGQAPDAWQLEKTYSGIKNHPWTLFVREYEDDEGVCNELDFEKANNLGGYEIRVSLNSYGETVIRPDNVRVNVFENSICDVFLSPLNATLKILEHSSLTDMGFVDEKGIPHDILAEVSNASSDIAMIGRYFTSLMNLHASYPFFMSELQIVTQYRGYESQLSKICTVLDSNSRIGLCLVFLVNILFFKYFLGQPVIVAHLSTLRIVCSSCLPKIPGNDGPRIYLGSFFLFMLTIHGIYQGQLAKLLTKQKPLRNVNTKKDLLDLGYTIYGFKTYGVYFNDSQFEGRFLETEKSSCTNLVLKDSKSACVNDKNVIYYDAAKFKLHLSREPIDLIFMALPMREDWPVERHFNRIVLRLWESHQTQLAYQKVTRRTYRALESHRAEIKDQSFKILTLKQMCFAFIILGIGLACATLSFAIELAVAKLTHVELPS